MTFEGDYLDELADTSCPANSIPYIIHSGDTFFRIAQRLGTTVATLTALNPWINPNLLQIGQQICIPAASDRCPGGAMPYTIQPGDTLYGIANRFNIALQALLRTNPGVNSHQLLPGQIICLPEMPSPTGTLRQTPLCALLQPVLDAIPASADIPIGSITIRQVAMSTRAYTMVASPLPNPSIFGNYDTYVGVLNLITDDPAMPRETVYIRLMPSSFGNQLITWAGTIITAYPPTSGDSGEIRPFNSLTGGSGPTVLQGNL